MLDVVGFDHLVLRCADVEATLAWYCDQVGLAPVRVDEWRCGEAPFPSVRVDESTIIDLVPADGGAPVTANSHVEHICLVVGAASVERVEHDPAFAVIDGPGPRFGARGVATSIYVRDPDGLTVELRAYAD